MSVVWSCSGTREHRVAERSDGAVGLTGQPLESRASWCERVDAARRRCARGAVGEEGFRKVVLARAVRYRAPAGAEFDVAATVRALRTGHPDAVVYAAGLGDGRVLVGATPELLTSVRGARMETHALAGTMRRRAPGEMERADASDADAGRAHAGRTDAAAVGLLRSVKDRREHALVVDGIRDALTPLCQRLDIPGAPRARVLPRLVHLETPVVGQLRPGVGVAEVVDALHPTAALGGAPRAPALAWLRDHEPLDRGAYGAPLGYVLPNGDGDVVVAIRCALLQGEQATAFVGAGVVAESDPAAEWAETEAKLGCIEQSLRVRGAAAEATVHG